MDQSVSPYLFRKDTRHCDTMDQSVSPRKDRDYDTMDHSVSPFVVHIYHRYMDQSVSPHQFRKDTRHCNAMGQSVSPFVVHIYLE